MRRHAALRPVGKCQRPLVERATNRGIENIEALGVTLRAGPQEFVNILVDSTADDLAVILVNVALRVIIDGARSEAVLPSNGQRRDTPRQSEIDQPTLGVCADRPSLTLPTARLARHASPHRKMRDRSMAIDRPRCRMCARGAKRNSARWRRGSWAAPIRKGRAGHVDAT